MADVKPRLPLSIFEKMVKSVSPADLAKIPPEQLPLYIPDDFVKTIPLKSTSVVEGLLFEAESHRMSQRMEAEHIFDKKVASALDVASSGGSAVLTGIFPKKFEEAKTKHTNTESKDFEKAMTHLEELSAHIFDDAENIVKALNVLFEVKEEQSAVSAYINDCYNMLLDILKRLHYQMDAYALYRLKVLGPKLKNLGERAQSAARELVQLKKGIPETEKHIKSIAKNQNIRKDQMATHPQIQALQKQLATLKARKETLEVLVSKDDLYKHLDLIINGILIEKDADKKIAKYAYQLWGGVRELIVDYVRSALPADQYANVPEQVQKFVKEYFDAKNNFLQKTAGHYRPEKTKLLDALSKKMASNLSQNA